MSVMAMRVIFRIRRRIMIMRTPNGQKSAREQDQTQSPFAKSEQEPVIHI